MTGRPVATATRGPVEALGWATVELDRAADELGSILVPGSSFEPVTGSAALGARCRVGRVTTVAVSAPSGIGLPVATSLVVLLEPSTEGLLAGALARQGEGWCARWELARTDDPDPWMAGPLGEERLLRARDADGGFRLLLRPATIDP